MYSVLLDSRISYSLQWFTCPSACVSKIENSKAFLILSEKAGLFYFAHNKMRTQIADRIATNPRPSQYVPNRVRERENALSIQQQKSPISLRRERATIDEINRPSISMAPSLFSFLPHRKKNLLCIILLLIPLEGEGGKMRVDIWKCVKKGDANTDVQCFHS